MHVEELCLQMASTVLVFLLALLIHSVQSSKSCFPAFFIFGDSYFDVGNKAALYPQAFQQTGHIVVSNEPPYGQTFFKHATGRFSDGRMICDFLTQGLGTKDYPGAYLQSVGSTFQSGVNFALAGGTALSTSYYLSRNISTSVPYSLSDELGWFLRFKEVSDSSGKTHNRPPVSSFSKGLYIIGEIGSNDYTIGLFFGGLSPAYLRSTLMPLVMKQIRDFFKSLYQSGARNFLFVGLPPAVDGPGYRSFGDSIDRAAMYNLTSEHNKELREVIRELKSSYKDAFIAFADFERIHLEILTHPSKYGLINTTSACCGAKAPFNFDMKVGCGQPGSTVCSNPNQFVYWDYGHFTEHYSRLVASAFLSGEYLHPPDAFKRKWKCNVKL